MKKIQTFYKGNKPFVFLAFVFILLGIIFNDKLLNLTGQSAQIISITPAPTISEKPTSVQYPSR
jgi:hypothetical protein